MRTDSPPNPMADEDGELVERCASCGRALGWDGQPPSIDGDAWICGECDAARGFDVLPELDG